MSLSSKRWKWTVLGTLVLLVGRPAGAEDVSGLPPLVQQLGDDDFQTRTQAERQLLESGSTYVVAVQKLANSSDAEVRLRANRLLHRIRRTVFQERHDELENDPWTFEPALVPSWQQYHALVGDSLPARQLYAQMCEREPELMLSLGQPMPEWSVRFEQRCAEALLMSYSRAHTESDAITTAVLLFLAVYPKHLPSPNAINTLEQLISDQQFEQWVRSSPESPALRALLSHWVSGELGTSAYMRLSLAARFQLPAGTKAAMEIVDGLLVAKNSRTQSQVAILFLAQYGGMDVVPVLSQLLEDEANHTAVLPEGPIEKRPVIPASAQRAAMAQEQKLQDVALLGLVLVTGQNPVDYGFSNLKPDSNFGWTINSVYFTEIQARQAALEKWAQWRRNHLPSHAAKAPVMAAEGTLL